MKKRAYHSLLIIIPLTVLVLSLVLFFMSQSRNTALAGSTCDLPCWNEITPGKTSKGEAFEILYALQFVNKGSINVKEDSRQYFSGQVDFDLWPDITRLFPSARGSIYFHGDKVARILLAGNIGTRLGSFIETFGKPEYIFVDAPGEAYPYFLIFYPLSGIVIGGNVNKLESPITPENQVDIIQLIAPELFQNLFEKGELLLFSQTPKFKVFPWRGYGTNLEDYLP